jgi:hypothetical protein
MRVDANVLVRLITRDDAHQAASADIFVEKGAWVSVLALAEATWVLAAVYDAAWPRRKICSARGRPLAFPIASCCILHGKPAICR